MVTYLLAFNGNIKKMRNFLPRLIISMCLGVGFIPLSSQALPKFSVEHGKRPDGTPRVKITNETTATLACYVAIDGHKKKFVLGAYNSSIWYAAANNRYNHTSFRTWCGLLELYPKYEKYRKR